MNLYGIESIAYSIQDMRDFEERMRRASREFNFKQIDKVHKKNKRRKNLRHK